MDAYINELIDSFNKTVFVAENGLVNHDYCQGMTMLVEKFTWHKKRASQIFL